MLYFISIKSNQAAQAASLVHCISSPAAVTHVMDKYHSTVEGNKDLIIGSMYRGSPTSTVSTSTNSTSKQFQKILVKFHLYDFPLKSPSTTK